MQAVGCCQHVLPEFGEMESLPKPVYGECRIKRQPDCGQGKCMESVGSNDSLTVDGVSVWRV